MWVSDTGSGIDPEHVDKIFDPYFTTKEAGKGTGMGLAVVHGIVNTHSGFVRVESDLGKGTTFEVFFPRTEKGKLPENKDIAGEIQTGNERILFVDDEKQLVKAWKSILEKLGYSVTGVTDSAEALELFKNVPYLFDLVITDQTMPDITGTEMSKQLLRIRSDIPIILCTGYSSNITEVKTKSIGIRKFVMKPIDKDHLAQNIREVLDDN
jgi:CheY-like chemotaxis protein